MSLQSHPAPVYATSIGNVIGFPTSELARMFEDVQLALEFEPERAPNIALEFVRRMASSGWSKPDARGSLAPWQARKVDRYLRQNLERSIRISEVAREVKLSVSHFCRAFKKTFAETPHVYVLKLRLELARHLMLTTDDPLGQIALSCGLADQAHLSKLFRRVYQDTPNAWRRRNLSEAHTADDGRTRAGRRRAA